MTGAAYTNNDLNADTATALFDIDTTNDRVSLQSPANAGNLAPTGNLGVDAGPNAGFDIYFWFECVQERGEALRLPRLPVREEPPSVREEPSRVREKLPFVGREHEQLGPAPSPAAAPPSLPSRHAYAALDEEMRAALVHMLTSRPEPQCLALGPEAWIPVAALHPVPSPARTPEAESVDYAPAKPRTALPGRTSRSHDRGSLWEELLGSMAETGHRATREGKDSTNAVAAYLGLAERTACQKDLRRRAEHTHVRWKDGASAR